MRTSFVVIAAIAAFMSGSNAIEIMGGPKPNNFTGNQLKAFNAIEHEKGTPVEKTMAQKLEACKDKCTDDPINQNNTTPRIANKIGEVAARVAGEEAGRARRMMIQCSKACDAKFGD